jgi:hypothetical protein
METPVAINTAPDVPRDPVSTMFMLIKVSSELSRHLTSYLEEGDISELRKSTNCMMILQSMQTKTYLPQLVAAGVRGVHPISDEERESLLRAFEQPA